VTAAFYCSFQTELQTWATISGSTGSVRISDFVLPTFGCEASFETNKPVFNVKNCSYHFEQHITRHAVNEYSDGHPDAQESRMIVNFSHLVLEGKLEPTWGEISLKTQKVLDACLRSARQGGTSCRVN
jgi:predicted dehydrogenase